MTSREIRESFLQFFKKKQHHIVPSAPIVIKDDPTLMFTNAGMNQFKDIFLGVKPAKYSRVADTQKCLRVSGKHNDLEEVGYDTYHHTFFEMLGNWSLGESSEGGTGYFKEEAIAWAWELLTDEYGIDKDRLYVTVFEGDKGDGLDLDEEAFSIWKKYIDGDRILMGNKKDNFWEMGESGPCGPCSEIHIDIRSDEERRAVDGKSLVNQDHPQVVEVWNLVFMQYNRKADGSLHLLPQRHVDTGMGFERLCMALQNKQSNYDTDIFQPLIQYIAKETNIEYGKEENTSIAMRVMADHIRAISFTISDGQLPSSSGAGYVIRRILRRAVRYAFTFLNLKEPFLYTMVDILAEQFEAVFPEFYSQREFVKKVIREEESSFLHTLSAGIGRFEKYAATHDQIEGKVAFELYDTYGFPIDLTQLLAREKGLNVDMEGFKTELNIQKERSRAATSIVAGDWIELNPNTSNGFIGYDALSTETKVVAYREVKVKGKNQIQICLQSTPFYPEGGGQVGDVGILDFDGEQINVLDTKKENDLILHVVSKLPKNISATLTASVNKERRQNIATNHTATHLMHAALKEVLGDHVEQKGSLVDDKYLRFDFSHFAKLSDAELREVEEIVNKKIRENIALEEQRSISLNEAKALGATALFGEKYGETVRMITFDPSYSRELCGGTHVSTTGMIGFFKIISESAVQAGVRRIEAISGEEASSYIFNLADSYREVKQLLNNPKNTASAIIGLQEENNKLKKELEKGLAEKVQQLKADLISKVEEIDNVNFLAQVVDLPSADALKNLSFSLKDQVDSLFLVLAAIINGKPMLSVMLSEELVSEKHYNAASIVRELAKDIQGGGGGQAFYATAGGKNAEGLQKAVNRAKDLLNKIDR